MIDDDIKNWIKHCEGLKLEMYVDITGNPTIGYGRNLSKGISKDEADFMFENDIREALSQLEKYDWYIQSPQNVKNAMLNMCFDLGIAGLNNFRKMIMALQKKDYTTAAMESLASKWARQVGQRAKDVALMIRQG